MKTVNWIVGTIAVFLVIVLTATNPRNPVPAYTAETEGHFTGVVTEVQEFYCPLSGDQGIHLLIKTGAGMRMVHVAPGRFLRSHDVRFQPGDQVEVSGAQVRFQGDDAIIARELGRGNEVLTLRDKAGKPAWQ